MRNALWFVLPAVIVVGGCAGPAATTMPSGPPSASAPGQTVPATASPVATPPPAIASPATSSSAAPTAASAGDSLVDELVAVVTEDLLVRSRPGTGSDSEVYAFRLNAPDVVYVIDGPERADGYDWYLVDLVAAPCWFGCDFAPRPGWVAAADTDGERWLADQPEGPACPQPTLDQIAVTDPQLRLYCFGAEELTLQGGVVGGLWGDPAWPWASGVVLYGPDYRGPIPGCVDLCVVPWLTAGVEAGGEVPPYLSTPTLSGHFDDARATECRSFGSGADQRILTHECRKVFVVTHWD